MFVVKFLTQDQVQHLAKSLKEVFRPASPNVFEGFYYFGPQSINTNIECKYIVAFLNHEMVGVLQLYPEKTENVFAVSFVNVHSAHREKGISKILYEGLNEQVKPNWIVYGTDLSEDGKKYSLYNLRKRIITNCRVYDNEDDYREKHLGIVPYWIQRKREREERLRLKANC